MPVVTALSKRTPQKWQSLQRSLSLEPLPMGSYLLSLKDAAFLFTSSLFKPRGCSNNLEYFSAISGIRVSFRLADLRISVFSMWFSASSLNWAKRQISIIRWIWFWNYISTTSCMSSLKKHNIWDPNSFCECVNKKTTVCRGKWILGCTFAVDFGRYANL